MNKHVFVTETEALKEDFKGRTNYWLCHSEVCGAKDLQICRAVLPAGEGHNFHTHPELEEAIYVLEGQVEQWVEREKRMLNPGEVAFIPKGVVHATFNPTARDAVILAILSPAIFKGPFAVDVSAGDSGNSLPGGGGGAAAPAHAFEKSTEEFSSMKDEPAATSEDSFDDVSVEDIKDEEEII